MAAGADPAASQPGQGGRQPFLFGPLTSMGIAVAVAAGAIDQAVKLWLLFIFDLGSKGFVRLAPFLDLVLTWNTGISYGWLQGGGPFGPWALLAFKVIAVVVLWVWLARAGSTLVAVSLGLIIGGAVGNAIDRVVHGAVVDFVFFHITTATWSFRWYVFNLADVAIVAGVVGLLYDTVIGDRAAKAP